MDIRETLKAARAQDKAIMRNKDAPTEAVWEAMGRANGRKFLIGSITGAMRVVGGVIALPFGLIGATFCLIGAGVSSLALLGGRRGAGALKGTNPGWLPVGICLEGAKSCGKFTFEKIKSVARGTVEIIPFTGYALAKYDLSHPLTEKYKITTKAPPSASKVDATKGKII